MSTVVVWETGSRCDGEGCGREFALGEEVLYWYGRKLHQECASRDAASRREAAGESQDVLGVCRRQLAGGGRVILTRRQLREVAGLACRAGGFEPVHRPDAGGGRQQWYGRLTGWSAARVAAGLSPAEVAGLWLDFLDSGRLPPLRACDVGALVEVIAAPVTSL